MTNSDEPSSAGPRRPKRLRLAALVAGAAAALSGGGIAATPALADAPAAATFYVSCTSLQPAGDGSLAHPWISIAQVYAHGAFNPGDQILLRRGTTCHGELTLRGSGTASARITLGAYGTGALPTIGGDGTADNSGAVTLADSSYWTIQDLHLTNRGRARYPAAKRAGLLLESVSPYRIGYITAQRLVIDSVDSSASIRDNSRAYGGIAVVTLAKGRGFDGVLIQNNRLTGVGRSGIAEFNMSSHGYRDNGTRITGNRVDSARGDSIVISGSNNARIDHNLSLHGSNLTSCPLRVCGPLGSVGTSSAGIWPMSSDHVRIDHNEVYGERSTAGDGAGIDVDLYASHVTVESNYLHGNAGGGIMFCGAHDATVRFNVLQANGKSAFIFTCGWRKDQRNSGVTIVNNDVYARGTAAAWVVRNMHAQNPGGRVTWSNNLVDCAGTCRYSWPGGVTAASNTYVGSRSSSEPRGTGTRHQASPLRKPGSGGVGFGSLKGYHPRSASAVRGGVRIGGSGIADVFGHGVSSSYPPRGAAVS